MPKTKKSPKLSVPSPQAQVTRLSDSKIQELKRSLMRNGSEPDLPQPVSQVYLDQERRSVFGSSGQSGVKSQNQKNTNIYPIIKRCFPGKNRHKPPRDGRKNVEEVTLPATATGKPASPKRRKTISVKEATLLASQRPQADPVQNRRPSATGEPGLTKRRKTICVKEATLPVPRPRDDPVQNRRPSMNMTDETKAPAAAKKRGRGPGGKAKTAKSNLIAEASAVPKVTPEQRLYLARRKTMIT